MSGAALDHVGIVLRDLATLAPDAPSPETFQIVLNIARPPMIMPRKDARLRRSLVRRASVRVGRKPDPWPYRR